jgi:F-type H+-transporting ATPase subunit epsilon
MADTVQFELVSPERILRSEAVEMVVVPGSEGNFGVLPGHAPLMSSVRPGTIEVYRGNVLAERIFVTGGFAEVTAERCTVLADEAVDVAALDRTAVEANIGHPRHSARYVGTQRRSRPRRSPPAINTG